MKEKKLKRVFLLLVLLTIFLGLSAEASTGIGIILGEPSGLSIKINRFPVLALAWSVDKHLMVNCDYWIKNSRFDRNIYWYFGFGVSLRIINNQEDNVGLGLRIPIGLSTFLAKKLELFGELAPGMSFFPATDRTIAAGIGLRFYIN